MSTWIRWVPMQPRSTLCFRGLNTIEKINWFQVSSFIIQNEICTTIWALSLEVILYSEELNYLQNGLRIGKIVLISLAWATSQRKVTRSSIRMHLEIFSFRVIQVPLIHLELLSTLPRKILTQNWYQLYSLSLSRIIEEFPASEWTIKVIQHMTTSKSSCWWKECKYLSWRLRKWQSTILITRKKISCSREPHRFQAWSSI